jgi:hypothetical protein
LIILSPISKNKGQLKLRVVRGFVFWEIYVSNHIHSVVTRDFRFDTANFTPPKKKQGTRNISLCHTTQNIKSPARAYGTSWLRVILFNICIYGNGTSSNALNSTICLVRSKFSTSPGWQTKLLLPSLKPSHNKTKKRQKHVQFRSGDENQFDQEVALHPKSHSIGPCIIVAEIVNNFQYSKGSPSFHRCKIFFFEHHREKAMSPNWFQAIGMKHAVVNVQHANMHFFGPCVNISKTRPSASLPRPPRMFASAHSSSSKQLIQA